VAESPCEDQRLADAAADHQRKITSQVIRY
jgi:hypothetical protein